MEVLIVGAGITGLTAAHYLHKAGHSVKVFEKANQPGGRAATLHTDGFTYDCGFQVLQTAYPEVKDLLDLDALGVRAFKPGALLLLPHGEQQRMIDPRRGGSFVQSAVGEPGNLADKIKLLRLANSVKRKTVDEIFAQDFKGSALEVLEKKFSPKMMQQFLQPFFSGVFLDDSLSVDYRLFQFVFKMFNEGDAVLPREGIGAIAKQLELGLPAHTVHYNAEVQKIEGNTVWVGGKKYVADKVLLAVEGQNPLLDGLIDKSEMRWGQVTHFLFAANDPPFDEAVIGLNTLPQPTFNNIVVYDYVQREYSVPGKFLISVSTNEIAKDELAQRKQIRVDLAKWFGNKTMGWDYLRTHVIEHALPFRKQANHHPFSAVLKLNPQLYVAGDHLLYGSLNAAMRSGRIAALELCKIE